MTAKEISSQKAKYGNEVIGNKNDNVLQAGTNIKVPMIKKNDGSIDMDAVQNFLKFLYVPIEALKYINDRIKEIENKILVDVLGDFSEEQEDAKNEMQVQKKLHQ